MAVTRKYSGTPLQVVATEEMRNALEEIATKEDVSIASVIRDCIELGMAGRRSQHEHTMRAREGRKARI